MVLLPVLYTSSVRRSSCSARRGFTSSGMGKQSTIAARSRRMDCGDRTTSAGRGGMRVCISTRTGSARFGRARWRASTACTASASRKAVRVRSSRGNTFRRGAGPYKAGAAAQRREDSATMPSWQSARRGRRTAAAEAPPAPSGPGRREARARPQPRRATPSCPCHAGGPSASQPMGRPPQALEPGRRRSRRAVGHCRPPAREDREDWHRAPHATSGSAS